MPEVDPYRLPTTVVPSRYELELAPDLAAASFDGTVDIAVDVREPVDEIVLNALELEIDEAWVDLPDGTRLEATVSLDADTERAALHLGATAPVGPAAVHARFRGALNDKLNGFYRSTFKGVDGTEHVIATTQMEATYARKAFPCWDEPVHKATFAVTLVVPEGLTALSNGAELEREALGDGRVRVRFADTMVMSTYLVAFIVGPLEVTDPVDVDGVPLRIACPPGKLHLTPYALEVGGACLRYFTDYYAIPYPGGKLDLVAIPDFAFGAMENTGCVTFREVLLTVDPAVSTQPELLNVTDVINHEIAHMWFGNLVTMGWWEGIWLNEAFATFMEMKATEAFRPDWNRWVEFGLSRTAAFDTDGLDTTRPIEFPVVSPDEAEGMFDVLTYEKGGAVLRMLEQYLGEDRFREGIRLYLRTHAYGNTVTTDLWDAIEQASGEPVRRVMDTWIYQGGHPVVEVDLVGDTKLRLRQERFRLSAASDVDGPDAADDLGDNWAIPVVLKASVAGEVREHRMLLDGREEDVDLGGPVDWVVVNAGGSGFYRVRYTAALRDRLVAAGIGSLEVLERYGLLDDAMAMVVAGSMTAVELLELARAYGDERDVAVWRRLRDALVELDRVVDDAGREAFRSTVRALAAPALRRVGFAPGADDDDRLRELRGVLLFTAAVLGGDTEAIEEARRVRADGIADPASVDPPLFAAATTVMAETGGVEEYETALARFRSATTPQEEVRELYNLGRFHDPALTDRTCELAITEIRTQNAPYLLRVALQNRTEGGRVWSFLARNWSTVNDRFPSNSIVRMLEGVTSVADEAVSADVHAFFAEHEVPQGAKQLAQQLERQRATVALRRREGEALAAALKGE
jgi:puromycin-sensitive aminopeptidase